VKRITGYHFDYALTITMAGDRDVYNRTDKVVEIYRSLPRAEMGLIPGCGHVVLECNPRLTMELIVGFLGKVEK